MHGTTTYFITLIHFTTMNMATHTMGVVLRVSHPQRNVALHRRHLHRTEVLFQFLLDLFKQRIGLGARAVLQSGNQVPQVGFEFARLSDRVCLLGQRSLLVADLILE